MEDRVLADRYLMGGVLGAGAAAVVHRAWDTRVERAVAVKVFRGVPDEVELRRFHNEAHTLAMLSHPGLVDVYDAGAEGTRPFIVLKLIEGRTLRERIADGPVPVDAVRRVGARLADALAYVHARGVTHRDVKPSNILLDAGGRPHLADFGVAKLIGAERVTATNEMIGTAAYLAPEQVRGHEVGSAADIYAFGLVLLECLTGTLEYDGTDVESAIARLHRPPAIPDTLPRELAILLARMTSLTPRRRPTAGDCADLLAGKDSPVSIGGAALSLAGSGSADAGAAPSLAGSGVSGGEVAAVGGLSDSADEEGSPLADKDSARTLLDFPADLSVDGSRVQTRGSAPWSGGVCPEADGRSTGEERLAEGARGWGALVGARRGVAAVAAGLVGVVGVGAWMLSGVEGAVIPTSGTAVIGGAVESGGAAGEAVPADTTRETTRETSTAEPADTQAKPEANEPVQVPAQVVVGEQGKSAANKDKPKPTKAAKPPQAGTTGKPAGVGKP